MKKYRTLDTRLAAVILGTIAAQSAAPVAPPETSPRTVPAGAGYRGPLKNMGAWINRLPR